jgi:hypothetical protein
MEKRFYFNVLITHTLSIYHECIFFVNTRSSGGTVEDTRWLQCLGVEPKGASTESTITCPLPMGYSTLQRLSILLVHFQDMLPSRCRPQLLCKGLHPLRHGFQGGEPRHPYPPPERALRL